MLCSGETAGSASSARSRPSIERVWVSALRLVSAMISSARSAAATSVRMTCPPTPACTAIRDMLCATTSCSSRAIRSRSSTTARAASSRAAAASCSAIRSRSDCWMRRERIASPRAHAVRRRAQACRRSEVPRSGTSSTARPMKTSRQRTRPATPFLPSAVRREGVEAEQQQHREQADVVVGQGHDEAARDEHGERGHRPATTPDQGQPRHEGGGHRQRVGGLEPGVDAGDVGARATTRRTWPRRRARSRGPGRATAAGPASPTLRGRAPARPARPVIPAGYARSDGPDLCLQTYPPLSSGRGGWQRARGAQPWAMSTKRE